MAEAPKTPLFEFEPNVGYLLKHWKRFAALLAAALFLLWAVVWGLQQMLKPEGTVRVAVRVKTLCALGKEELRPEQTVYRRLTVSDHAHLWERLLLEPKVEYKHQHLVFTRDGDKVVGEEIAYSYCEKDLFKVAVLDEGFGDTRFHKDAAWLEAKGIVGITNDQLARRLLGPLKEKYPGAAAFEVLVDGTLYDFSRSADLFNKYERHDVIDQRMVKATPVADRIALPTATFTPTPEEE